MELNYKISFISEYCL